MQIVGWWQCRWQPAPQPHQGPTKEERAIEAAKQRNKQQQLQRLSDPAHGPFKLLTTQRPTNTQQLKQQVSRAVVLSCPAWMELCRSLVLRMFGAQQAYELATRLCWLLHTAYTCWSSCFKKQACCLSESASPVYLVSKSLQSRLCFVMQCSTWLCKRAKLSVQFCSIVCKLQGLADITVAMHGV